MTENEVFEHISNLAGDYKCFDEKISHQESLILCNLIEEIQQYRAIGTVEEFKEMKSGDFTEHLLNMGYTKGYNKAIEEMQGNLIRNSRTEVIDGKICFVVTDERIKQIADIMKTQ